MSDLIKIIFIVVFAVLLVIFGPLAVIWSVNTLFPAVDIKYTFDTWCAILLLGAFIRANVTVKK
jgi:hypothetical protein